MGERRLHIGALHIGAWRHGVSVYGWSHGRDAGLAARHPELENGKGTLRLPPKDGASLTDAEPRELFRSTLDA